MGKMTVTIEIGGVVQAAAAVPCSDNPADFDIPAIKAAIAEALALLHLQLAGCLPTDVRTRQ